MRQDLTPAEVARKLGVSAATVRRWEVRGVLKPCRRLPGKHGHRRYSPTDVDRVKALMASGEAWPADQA